MITVKADDVARILSNALAHAGKDDKLPVLNAVRLECESGTLTAVATDRYSLGLDTAAVVEGSDTFTFLVGRDDVNRIVKACKEHGKSWRNVVGGPTVTLTATADTLTLEVPGTSITARGEIGEFPRYRSLIPDTSGDGTPHIALTASNLAKLTKLVTGSKNTPLRFYFNSPTKPVVVRVDTFVGLLMPCRIEWEAVDSPPLAAAV
jgi:DNA polymerase III sliding clamp (beta) subunit (PCNA family)